MSHTDQRYAPRRRVTVVVWLTALVAPALLGLAFWSATAGPSTPAPAQLHVLVSADPVGFEQVGFGHR